MHVQTVRAGETHRSSVGVLPISPAASSASERPSSTEQTLSVIGSSTPSRCERSRSTGAVVSPSTTWPISRDRLLGRPPLGDQLARRGGCGRTDASR